MQKKHNKQGLQYPYEVSGSQYYLNIHQDFQQQFKTLLFPIVVKYQRGCSIIKVNQNAKTHILLGLLDKGPVINQLVFWNL